MDQDTEGVGEVPPLDPMLGPFITILTKGDKDAIIRGDFGVGNAELARALLDAIILLDDLAKYFSATMLDPTKCHEELLYEVINVLSLLFHNILTFIACTS